MKKIIVLILIVVALINPFALNTIVAENDLDDSRVFNILSESGIYEKDYKQYVLYGPKGMPEYMMFTTMKGYLIMDNDYIIREFGEGNPYSNIEGKYYYSGPLNYYIEDDNGYINILTGDYEKIIPEYSFIKDIEKDSPGIKSTNSLTKVSNSYSYLLRRAFGYNSDGTCSAIATTLAINYLYLQTGYNLVPSNMRLEYLTGKATASNIGTLYPKANYFHYYLRVYCGMGTASIGPGIYTPFNTYVVNQVPSSYGFSMNYTISPSYNTIKNNINSNKPVLITTTLFAGDYNWHTMVAYGYQTVDGVNMLAVHTGWYSGDYVNNSSGQWAHKQICINKSYATYGYYFSFSS